MRSTDEPGSSRAAGEASAQVRHIAGSYIMSQTIGVAARLGIPDAVAGGSRSAEELAEIAGASVVHVYRRFLRACVGAGVLVAEGSDRFGLGPLGGCLRSDVAGSLRSFAIAFTEPGIWAAVGRLEDAVLTGSSGAEFAHGMPLWDWYRRNPEKGSYFAEAMSEYSAGLLDEIVAGYPFDRFEHIVDMGGSRGDFIAAILRAAPAATGALFDLPEIVEQASESLRGSSVEQRMEFVAGDFRTEAPGGADLYTFKGVLCDWPDDDAVRIVRNCHRVARAGSRLLVVETVALLDETAATAANLGDMFTLATVGGSLRSKEDYAKLFVAAGYELDEVVTTAGGASLLSATRLDP